MHIVFLCGSLEPGKDGVGDYTRRLVGELSRFGYNVSMIALHDSYTNSVEGATQTDEQTVIPTLRLPPKLSWGERNNLVKNFIKYHQIEWISLQYVPYAFHRKGLPFQWAKFFRQLAPACKWHVMMHELWIGSKKQDSSKDKLIGAVQQYIIKRTINGIQPSAVTTNISYYKVLLEKVGIKSAVLPVFSNLVPGDSKNSIIFDKLPLSIRQNRDAYYIAVLFGSVHSSDDVEQNIYLLQQKAATEQKKIVLTHIGRSGNIASLFHSLKTKYDCISIILGEQNAEDIASYFQYADFGTSTYARKFLGKSGSIAAMLNNKLPVVLLKEEEWDDNSQYSYAKFITEIDSLQAFCNQKKEWSMLYGLKNAAAFYRKVFLQHKI